MRVSGAGSFKLLDGVGQIGEGRFELRDLRLLRRDRVAKLLVVRDQLGVVSGGRPSCARG